MNENCTIGDIAEHYVDTLLRKDFIEDVNVFLKRNHYIKMERIKKRIEVMREVSKQEKQLLVRRKMIAILNVLEDDLEGEK